MAQDPNLADFTFPNDYLLPAPAINPIPQGPIATVAQTQAPVAHILAANTYPPNVRAQTPSVMAAQNLAQVAQAPAINTHPPVPGAQTPNNGVNRSPDRIVPIHITITHHIVDRAQILNARAHTPIEISNDDEAPVDAARNIPLANVEMVDAALQPENPLNGTPYFMLLTITLFCENLISLLLLA